MCVLCRLLPTTDLLTHTFSLSRLLSSKMAGSKPDAALSSWVRSQLQSFLGYPDDGQLTSHVLAFTNKDQLAEWAGEMLGQDHKVSAFVNELWRKKTGEKGGVYEERARPDTSAANMKLKHSTAGVAAGSSSSGTSAYSSSSSSAATPAPLVDLGRNVKVKFVAAKGAKGGAGPARMLCHCQATSHPLFTNCTACGKVVCEAEGEGPCFFCGSFVSKQGSFVSEQFKAHMRRLAEVENTPAQLAEADAKEAAAASSSSSSTVPAVSESASSGSDPVLSTGPGLVADSSDPTGLARAEAQKAKLLQHARAEASNPNANIFDAQNDWYEFESNSWLSTEVRAQKKKEAEQALINLDKRKQHTLTIDLAGKSIVTHSSDASGLELDIVASHRNEQLNQQTKWTDEVPAPNAHGLALAATFQNNPRLQRSVAEMQLVSRSQYYRNDTLSGRAKEVYDALKASLRPTAHSNPNDRSDIRPVIKSTESNALLSSLQAHSTHSRVQLSDDSDAGLDGISDTMSELEVEEKLAANRAAAAAKKCGASDMDDEPTNCARAMDSMAAESAFDDASDTGTCLSMFQPWASLLVLGIKRFEGRGWATGFKGRLWIAAGSRAVDPEEVAAVEAEYRAVYGPTAKIPFPKDYPTSALLGCVDMQACWSQEEFASWRSAQPAPESVEDSASAFVFVCTNPRILPVAQGISGQHKLFNLPKGLYTGLQSTLKPVPEKWRTSLAGSSGSAIGSSGSGGNAKDVFDLWPPVLRPALSSTSSSLQQTRPTISSLQPGMLLLKSALSLSEQQSLIDLCRSLGLPTSTQPGFSTPGYTRGPDLNLKMFCLGQSWNPNASTGKGAGYSAVDAATGKKVSKVPLALIDIVRKFQSIASDYLSAHGARDLLPTYTPDVCIVNYYSASSGKLGVHQDHSESKESISKGYPVISFSIGDAAEFLYGDKRQADDRVNLPGGGGGAGGYNKVTLSSGDVLLFGGPSRLVFHGVERIVPNTKPRELFMRQGRLNLTFRKM